MTIVWREGSRRPRSLDPSQPAGFAATYTRCRGARVAVQARVGLRGVARRFRLAVGAAHKPFAPCRGAIAVRTSEPRLGIHSTPSRELDPSIPDRPTAGRAAGYAIVPADAHGRDFPASSQAQQARHWPRKRR